jgi:hypothetical protein
MGGCAGAKCRGEGLNKEKGVLKAVEGARETNAELKVSIRTPLSLHSSCHRGLSASFLSSPLTPLQLILHQGDLSRSWHRLSSPIVISSKCKWNKIPIPFLV